MPDLSSPRFPTLSSAGVLRVVQDTGMITGDFQFLLVTPLIYFVLFFFTIACCLSHGIIAVKGLTKNVLTFYAIAGVMSTFVVSLVLLAWGMTHAHVDLFILAIIPLMAVTATAAGLGLHAIPARLEIRDRSALPHPPLWSAAGCKCDQLRH